MRTINQTLSFFKYFLNARTPGQLHSPYLFELLQFILDADRTYYSFDVLEDHRRVLLRDKTRLRHEDYGAGSKRGTPRRVCDVARSAVSSARKCAVYFKLAAYHKPGQTIEIGTSLGLSTAYVACGHQEGKVTTLDGSPPVLDVARGMFDQLGLQNIEVVEGQFSDTLPPTLERMGGFDLAFVDGNHRYGPTVDYVALLAEYANERSIVVIDDIRWSAGMWRAWKELSARSDVTASVDLFSFGLLFFRQEFRQKLAVSVIPARRLTAILLR